MNLSPILLFCYNRPKHLKKTVEALLQNTLAQDSDLFIFSDNFKNELQKEDVQAVRKYIYKINGFKNITIIERENNFGVSKSIIEGVSTIISKYGKVIVLEDDMITAPFFLKYMNECLAFYKRNESIFSIAGYTPPINIPGKQTQYISSRPCAWGWATWENRWNKVDWEMANFNTFIRDKKQRKKFNNTGRDSTAMLLNQKTGNIDTWDVRFYFSCFLMNKFCVYPAKSLLFNIGFDGSGSQGILSKKFDTEITATEITPEAIKPNDQINKLFQKAHEPSVLRKIINYFKLIKYLFLSAN